jgi:hypothetical protein
MVKDNKYGPDAYRRLELVRKQFKNQSAEKKKQMAAERKQRTFTLVPGSKNAILRMGTYIILSLIVIAVIITWAAGNFMK